MAFNYIFNFPIIELEIAKESIEKMNEDNSLNGDNIWKDEIKFKNNIKYGFIACTALISCFDSILSNMLIILNLKNEGKRIDKINRLLVSLQQEKEVFLKSKMNCEFKKMVDARNGLIHFNNYDQGYSGNLCDISTNDVSFDEIFNKENMGNHLENTKSILEFFAKISHLDINFSVDVFSSTGKSGRLHIIERKQNQKHHQT